MTGIRLECLRWCILCLILLFGVGRVERPETTPA